MKNTGKTKQEKNFIDAYGVGIISLEQLQQRVIPIREERKSLQEKLVTAEQTRTEQTIQLPSDDEIDRFTEWFGQKFTKELSFDEKREIVMSVVHRITGTQNSLLVEGEIPITSSNYVEYQTCDRDRGASERREIDAV